MLGAVPSLSLGHVIDTYRYNVADIAGYTVSGAISFAGTCQEVQHDIKYGGYMHYGHRLYTSTRSRFQEREA